MSTSDGGEDVCQEGHLDYQRENGFNPAVFKPLTLEQRGYFPITHMVLGTPPSYMLNH